MIGVGRCLYNAEVTHENQVASETGSGDTSSNHFQEGLFLMCLLSPEHQREAMPLHRLIVIIFGILAFTCVAGGIFAIVWNATSRTEFELLGAHLTTGHVGVAFVGIGLLIAFFTVKAVLKNVHELAALKPPAQTEEMAVISRGVTKIATDSGLSDEKARRLALIKAQMCEIVADAKKVESRFGAREWLGGALALLRHHMNDAKYASAMESEAKLIDSKADGWKVALSSAAAYLKGLESMLRVEQLNWE